MKNRTNLIFIVEANKQSKTDYMYIRRIIGEYYRIDLFRTDAIYAGSKGNLTKQDKKIERIKKDLPGHSYVILVVDVDSALNPAYSLNNDIEKYCNTNNYDIIWMNLTIEDVVFGETINEKKKVDKAISFFNKNKIDINVEAFTHKNPQSKRHSSNLFVVLDKYISVYKKST